MIEGNHSAWRAVRSVPKKVSFELSLKVKGNGLKEEMVGSMSGRGNPTARGKKTEMTDATSGSERQQQRAFVGVARQGRR